MDEERESTCYEMRVEMVMVAGQSGIGWTKRLQNTCMRQGKVPEEWRTGLFFPIWKRNGDVEDPENTEASHF